MATVHDTEDALLSRELRLDRLLGRMVIAPNNRPVGRLEEFRTEKRGSGLVVTAYVLGAPGLFERLGLAVRLLVGGRRGGLVASWDQLDISNPERPRLTCPVEELTGADTG